MAYGGVKLTAEEYGELLWAAIHDDRRVENPAKAITAHWDELPQHWRNKINDRATAGRLDVTGTAVLRSRS